MEDYHAAFGARKRDAEKLFCLQQHDIAAFHLGGVAIECRLKALLVLYHRINAWNQVSQRERGAMCNEIVKNPGHSLLTALRKMPNFYSRAKLDYNFLKHLHKLLFPLGATSSDYIGIRYIAQTSSEQNDWKQSFDYVCGWLKKNEDVAL